MKTKFTIIVTVDNQDHKDDEIELIKEEQLKIIKAFCRIKNQCGYKINGQKLTFELQSI